jgi:NAD(P) transhydrogenase subunit alpha
MGAEFLEVTLEEDGAGEGGYAKEMTPAFIAAELDLFLAQAKEVDIIVTTALIPGRPAPKLLERRHVEAMKPGSVIVDLASEQGGNCELTQPGRVVEHKGVTIVGHTNLASRLPSVASQLYGTNIAHLLDDLGGSDKFHFDLDDEVTTGALVVHDGKNRWPTPKPKPTSPTEGKKSDAPTVAAKGHGHSGGGGISPTGLLVAGGALLAVGIGAPPSFLTHFTVFVLAIFVGWQVIWNVSPALHTPLMSVTNAISGIIIIGGMLQISGPLSSPAVILGAVAVLLATINIAGGFLVTQRMLQMFRR